MDAVDRCNNYLISGGLFNPELAIHDNVRDMIIDCRDQMVAQKAEIEQLRKALQYAVDQYGKPGGPWNVPGSKGSWIDQAKKALNYKDK